LHITLVPATLLAIQKKRPSINWKSGAILFE